MSFLLMILSKINFLLQASPDTPIIKALNIFHESRVSALPIVDETGMGRRSNLLSW